MAKLSDILSPVWTLSISGGGSIAEGMEAIRQCLDIIVRTTKGSDPLRPEFGSDVSKYQDAPLNVAIPRMKKAILDSIALWEPRVSITSILSSLQDNSNVLFNLTYTLADKSLADSVSFLIGNGGILSGTAKQRLILRGFFPPNPANFQYQVALVLDGNPILPAPPATGFATLQDMYAWVQTNWLNYGQWYLNGISLVGYMNGTYSQGTLTISLLTQKRFEAMIPVAPIGYKYSLTVTEGVQSFSNTTDLFTPGQILSYVQNDPILGAMGFWQILTNNGSFNDDFMDDFDLYTQFLQVLTALPEAITITLSIVPQ